MLAPCIACHKCWRSYTLPEWDLLRPIPTELPRESADIEHRLCECGEELTADVGWLSTLDLEVDPVAYAADFPASGRPRAWAMAQLAALDRRRRRRTLAAAVLALALALVAALALAVPW